MEAVQRKEEVVDPYVHEWAFLNRAQMIYIFPTALSPTLRFLLKSKNEKYSKMSPKTHSTAVLTLLIDLLNSCCGAVRAAPLNGPCRWTLKGYAGSPYKHNGWPVGDIQ